MSVTYTITYLQYPVNTTYNNNFMNLRYLNVSPKLVFSLHQNFCSSKMTDPHIKNYYVLVEMECYNAHLACSNYCSLKHFFAPALDQIPSLKV